jgi:hypothetical protein
VPHSAEEGERALEQSLTALVEDGVIEPEADGRALHRSRRPPVLLGAFIPSFEGMEWVPHGLVLGPQGVLDLPDMTATLVRPFGGLNRGWRAHGARVGHLPSLGRAA